MSETINYGISDGATEGMCELLHAVREGRAEAVPDLLGPLTEAERRACLPVLKGWRTTTRNNWDDGHGAIRAALLLAGGVLHRRGGRGSVARQPRSAVGPRRSLTGPQSAG